MRSFLHDFFHDSIPIPVWAVFIVAVSGISDLIHWLIELWS
jgi:hypothetical protein